jgi:hypothetical protein
MPLPLSIWLARSLLVYQKAGASPVPSVGAHEGRSTIYVPHFAANLACAKNFEVSERESLIPHLGFFTQTPDPVSIARNWVVHSASEDFSDDADLNDEEGGEDLWVFRFYPSIERRVARVAVCGDAGTWERAWRMPCCLHGAHSTNDASDAFSDADDTARDSDINAARSCASWKHHPQVIKAPR